MKRSLALAVTLGLALPAPLYAWDVYTEIEDGVTFSIAEQDGEQDHTLAVVCVDRSTNFFEVYLPYGEPSSKDMAVDFQVDLNPVIRIYGYIERLDRRSAVFVGLDDDDDPSESTDKLIAEMKSGAVLSAVDEGETIVRWSLSGSSKAIQTMQANCK